MGMHIWQADLPKSITIRCLETVSADGSPLTQLTKPGLTFSLLSGTQDIEVIGPLIEEGHPVFFNHYSEQTFFCPEHRNPSFKADFFF